MTRLNLLSCNPRTRLFISLTIRLSESLIIFQINFNELELVNGPLGLEAAVFLADVLIKYHQQLKLEHNLRYITSDCAKAFGNFINFIKI